ncbi:alpha/beta fold hydrolase [Shimia biformata]|uniref:alpha/beta fold hydrolase n=1 Tax=Shimia biformata TaxID=1294299 RepID=UPI00195234F2|nr:alpha/beta fold hydrolase [Shimia biformata]
MTEPLVLVPGFMCDARVFEPQITTFSAERPVMVSPITTGDTVRDMAAAILAGAPAKFALAGLSLGGIVAMEVLRQAPDRVSRLALLDTNPLSETPNGAAAYEPLLVQAKAGHVEEALRGFMSPDYLAPGPKRMELINLFVRMGQGIGAEVMTRQVRAMQRRPDQQGTLRRCKVPTLLLCGALDRLTPPKRHEFMAELIPFAKLAMIEDAGHLPTLEQPEATTAALRGWLAQPYVLR